MLKITTAVLLASLSLAACQTQDAGSAGPVTGTAAKPSGNIVEVGGVALNDIYDLEALAAAAAQVVETADACAIGWSDLDGQIKGIDAKVPTPQGAQKGWVTAAYEAGRKARNQPGDSAACGPNEKAPVLRMVDRMRADLAAPAFQSWLAGLKA
ncbi:hypothetical protein ACFSM5_15115 [Lacibacterium aquatile]|uniref:Lipoprotein n=1 Tax=Lacibacterium aquatile TaxID=1168082 RepID=A0ABW5DXQ4_9PROT